MTYPEIIGAILFLLWKEFRFFEFCCCFGMGALDAGLLI